jgi:hypothetical protein
MILDALQCFTRDPVPANNPTGSFIQTVTATAVSTNVLDYGVISGIPSSAAGGGARDMGVGHYELKLLVQTLGGFIGANTLTITIQGAPDNGSGAPGGYVDWWASPAYALATLNTVGARLLEMDFPRPPAGVVVPRFVRLNFTASTAFTGTGGLQAFVLVDRDDAMYNSTNNAIMGGYAPGIVINN